MRIQVFCDLARHYGKLRFAESSDKDIGQIDFDALANYFHNHPLPESSLSSKVGTYRSISINVKDHLIDLNLLKGLGLAEKPLQQLIQQDASTQPQRKLPGELVAAWNSLPAFFTEQEGLGLQPLFDQEKIALCLHGGSYIMGSPGSHRQVIGKLSETCKLRCLVIDYRLAPLYPFPAQIHDALIAYFFLLDQGFKSQDIILVGDSAGGHLCIDLVLALRHISSRQPNKQTLLPRAICLLSPMPGVALEGESLYKYEAFDYLTPIPIEWPTCPLRLFYKPGSKCTPEYLKEIRTPLLSPSYGDLTGFPPTIIQAGSKEILLDDIRTLYHKLKQDNPADGHVVWEEYPDMVHVFHRFLHRTETTQAFQSISEFLRVV
ncbi:alpha/beta hydrolase fold-domain-containing protein [Coemansia mojavensis]|nr:alpha/beta hydrolase fold-domain-containing protein [Coemansia mojavensis]